MKKGLLCTLLAIVMVVVLAACGTEVTKDNVNKESTQNTQEESTQQESNVTIESPVALLDSVWSMYAEEDKFPVMGGDFETAANDAAGSFNISDVENATASLHITEEALKLVDNVGTITHAMNANTFSAAAYHLADKSNAKTFVESLKDSIKGTQWMCGFPDTLIIYTVADEYVVAAFGNADAIENFKTKLETVYGKSAILNVEQSLA